ncbi:unnamed protein product [Schistosoma turkestanicum]|nr:unnamed protein product [Schistosoma turkestanicum]
MCTSAPAFRKYYRPEPKKPYLHSMKLKSPFGRPTRSSYLRSRLSYERMEREHFKDLRRDDSNIFDCNVLTEPIHRLITNSLVRQLSIKPTDLYSYLVGSQMTVKVKQEISKSLDFRKKTKPNRNDAELRSANCKRNKIKRKSQTSRPSTSFPNADMLNNIDTNNFLIVKSKNALSHSCSISTRLNLNEIDGLNSEFVNLENNISVCLKIQGTQRSNENILSSGRAYSIPSISTERMRRIFDDELCVYGYQTGNTSKASGFHELDDVPENQLHAMSFYDKNKQVKMSRKTSTRPKSAGEAYNRMSLIRDMKGLLNIQSIDTPPKSLLSSARYQPNRIKSARNYRPKRMQQIFSSCLNSTDNLNLQNTDNSVSHETITNSVHSARQRADIHLPNVKYLMETYDDVEK